MFNRLKTKRDYLFISLLIILGCLFFFNTYKATQENRALQNYLDQIPELEIATDHKKAIMVSEALRKDFNVNSTSWQILSKRKEPLLKYSALNLLKWKEGHCGKGTRVLVLLLNKLGFNATRITLYGKDFTNRSAHTLVSILINGEEYLIDSINSNREWNESLKSKRISTTHLFPPLSKRKEERTVAHSYVNYSYETYPLAMLSKGLKLKTMHFNHTRPLSGISWIMESVYALLSTFFIGMFLFVSCIWYFLNKRQNKNKIDYV